MKISEAFGIDMSLYAKGNIVIPMGKRQGERGIYGSKHMEFIPKNNMSYVQEFYVYKDLFKRLESTTLGCRNYEKEESVGQCIVKFVEDTYNCTTYQIFADRRREFCKDNAYEDSKRLHRKLGYLSEYGIFNVTKCLPNCEHGNIDIKNINFRGQKESVHTSPIFKLEFQFEDEVYDVKEEYILYDTDSFIADVGGYLGLLLGHSMLSIYSSFVELLSKSMIWMKSKLAN